MSCPAPLKRTAGAGGSGQAAKRARSSPVTPYSEPAVKLEPGVKVEPGGETNAATAGSGGKWLRRSSRVKIEPHVKAEDSPRVLHMKKRAVKAEAKVKVKVEVEVKVKAEAKAKSGKGGKRGGKAAVLPYPNLKVPTEAQCKVAVAAMAAEYGLPSEREERKQKEKRPLLDSLVGTILSQNTTDVNSRRAFLSLKAGFPTWRSVLDAKPGAVEEAIRSGGLADIKADRIRIILQVLPPHTVPRTYYNSTSHARRVSGNQTHAIL